MKITKLGEEKVKREKVKREYRLGGFPIGNIIEYDDGVIGIIIRDNHVEPENVQNKKTLLLLRYSCGDDWFSLDGGGYLDDFKQGKFKVLGMIDEIIVK